MPANQVRLLIVRQPSGFTKCWGFVFSATEATKGANAIRTQLGLPVTKWRSVGVGSRIQEGSGGSGWYILDLQLGHDEPVVHAVGQVVCQALGGPGTTPR